MLRSGGAYLLPGQGSHSSLAMMSSIASQTFGTHAGMHEEAQSGEAAHAAYKGGLAPGLARRLHGFLELSASPPALPVPALWSSSEAAAEELFR